MGETIGIFELVKLIKNKWYIVVLASMAGFCLAFVVTTYVIQPQYSASTNLLVSRPQVGDQRFELGEIQTNIQMINTYRDVIEDAVVLDKVIEGLDGELTKEELTDKINVITQSDSQIFGIEITDSQPERAALIANLVAVTFKESVIEIMNVEDVVILSPAVPNRNTISPNNLFNVVIGTLAGVILGIAILLGWSILDTRVHDERFISDELKWNRLGSITSMRKGERLPLSIPDDKEIKQSQFVVKQAKGNVNR